MNSSGLSRQQPKKWIERLARFGYAAKGIVYMLVGILAFQAAINWGGRATSTEGAFLTIATQPFGKILLLLIVAGLASYVIWQLVQAAFDPEHDDSGFSTISRRIAYATGGFVYGSLALFALRVVFNQPTNGSDSSGQQAATLLSQPFGQWLVGAMGASFVAYGFFYFYRAYSTDFRRHLKLFEMSAKEEMWSTRIGRFGLTAKGVVSVIIGYFFIQAALAADPSQAKNTEGALQTIQQQPYGGWLMGLVALGLVAYGIHMGFQARYRRISP
ncbi:DUF1206 domain-containing protein [Nodosilinea sp. E11]|uniref:DUF1206 domain-containing protein n=1 Tax=Nodosilinea sp. E11 TaxID=3037479 RepID=UPI0029347188|nr:DUF1206 domain-containing protein [Nodosilinea sp. E11]WOD40146.1 DUF1206 domain-containing protein [Nodosilinea sp. E11]